MKLSVSSLTSWTPAPQSLRAKTTSGDGYHPQIVDLDEEDAPTVVAPPKRAPGRERSEIQA
jgi:hypothetical protein